MSWYHDYFATDLAAAVDPIKADTHIPEVIKSGFVAAIEAIWVPEGFNIHVHTNGHFSSESPSGNNSEFKVRLVQIRSTRVVLDDKTNG